MMTLVGLAVAFSSLLIVVNMMPDELLSLGTFVVPVVVIAYAFTFLLTDTISEVFGRRVATNVVWLGFAINILMVILIYVLKIIPPASFQEGQEAYILGSVPRVALASMLAYLASQHHDVFAFHFWRKLTKGRFLWLRNNASTMVSQGIDIILFTSVAFLGTVPINILLNMMIGQYVIRLVIAVLDTPLCYAMVRFIERRGIARSASMLNHAEK